MSDVVSALTVASDKYVSEGQRDFLTGTSGYSWGTIHPENTKNKGEGEKKWGGEERKESIGVGKQVLLLIIRLNLPEHRTHISKSCRQLKLIKQKGPSLFCQFGLFLICK